MLGMGATPLLRLIVWMMRSKRVWGGATIQWQEIKGATTQDPGSSLIITPVYGLYRKPFVGSLASQEARVWSGRYSRSLLTVTVSSWNPLSLA